MPSTLPIDPNDPVSSYIKLTLSFFADKFCNSTKLTEAALCAGGGLTAGISANIPKEFKSLDSCFAIFNTLKFSETEFWTNQVDKYLKMHGRSFDKILIADLKGFSGGGTGWVGEAKKYAEAFCKDKGYSFADAVRSRMAAFGENLVTIPADEVNVTSKTNGLFIRVPKALHDRIMRNPPKLSEEAKNKLTQVFSNTNFIDVLTEDKAFEVLDNRVSDILLTSFNDVVSVVNSYMRTQYASINALESLEAKHTEFSTAERNALKNGDVLSFCGRIHTTTNRIDSSRTKLMIDSIETVSAQSLSLLFSYIFADEIKQGKVYISPPNEDSKRLFVDIAVDSDAYLLLSAKTNEIEASRSCF